MDMIKKIPVPICGVALGCAALGNLLQSYSETLRIVCGVVSALFLLLFIIKAVAFPKLLAEDMTNPIMASVSGTFSMTLMLLSTYIKGYLGAADVAFVVWVVAIALHVALIVFFTAKFVAKIKLQAVFASYYIVYVGIAVAAVTAPAYEATAIGAAAFWFGLVSFVALFVLVTMRYVKLPNVPEPAKPLICIYAAPMSLCLAGYVQSVMPKNHVFLLAMFAVATVIYLFALVQLVRCLSLPFYPSYAAFTFPFVISAIASKMTAACLMNMGAPLPWLAPVVLVETVIAAILVVYTCVRYLAFLKG
ncbi:MAG: TDT family transporter [Collinsella sp.]|nr:TDT family transporter [Collinsella sp.]